MRRPGRGQRNGGLEETMQTPYTTSRFPIRDTLLPGTSVRARGLGWEVVHDFDEREPSTFTEILH